MGTDTIPINSSTSPNGAWWLVILEKAYAKMNVNYDNLNGGTPTQSFRDLTGMPVQQYMIADQSDNEFYDTIDDANKRKWPVVAACVKKIYGLNDFHAYTVIDVVTLNFRGRAKTVQKLIKLRNPWGTETYNGGWNDTDSRWTEALKD